MIDDDSGLQDARVTIRDKVEDTVDINMMPKQKTKVQSCALLLVYRDSANNIQKYLMLGGGPIDAIGVDKSPGSPTQSSSQKKKRKKDKEKRQDGVMA
jgi:hypothetical protein